MSTKSGVREVFLSIRSISDLGERQSLLVQKETFHNFSLAVVPCSGRCSWDIPSNSKRCPFVSHISVCFKLLSVKCLSCESQLANRLAATDRYIYIVAAVSIVNEHP